PGGSSSGSAGSGAPGGAPVGYGTDTRGGGRPPPGAGGGGGGGRTRGRRPRRGGGGGRPRPGPGGARGRRAGGRGWRGAGSGGRGGVGGRRTAGGGTRVAGVRRPAPSLDTVGPMAADVAGLVAGMELLEPGFAAAQAPGSLLVGRLRVPAAPEVTEAVTEALRATSWEVSDVDPGEWLTATRWTSSLLVAEAYRTNQAIFHTNPTRLSGDVARRLEAGPQGTDPGIAAAARAPAGWRA